MELYVDIGVPNDYQQKRLNQLVTDYDLKLVSEVSDSTDVLLITRWSESFKSSGVKAVFVPYTGLNRYPLDYFKEQKIKVHNSHAKAHLVAERAFALTLTVMGKIHEYHDELSNGVWTTRANWNHEFWYSLRRKKCGIVGMGHIGFELVKLLNAFECDIVNLKRDVSKDKASIYVDTFEELVDKSDVIYLTCPLNDATKHLVNMDNINLFKDKVLINVARGEIIQEEALRAGFEKELLLGAGIDVWYQYPEKGNGQPSKYPLNYVNLIKSPHASCHAIEFKDAYYEDIFNQLEDYLEVSNV